MVYCKIIDDERKRIKKRINKIINRKSYILGEEVFELEDKLKKYVGCEYCLTCGNGTDGLIMALMACGVKTDDYVVTTPFTFIATAGSIRMVGAGVMFTDIKNDDFNMDTNLINNKMSERVIVSVDIFGMPVDYSEMEKFKNRNRMIHISDCCQSFGSEYEGKKTNAYGDISVTSFYPGKLLGCYGDGGAIFTNNKSYYDRIKMIRNHGRWFRNGDSETVGMNSRLDTIQAVVILEKLKNYERKIAERRRIVKKIENSLNESIVLQKETALKKSIYSKVTIRVKNRNELEKKFIEKNVKYSIYYKTPLHLQKIFRDDWHIGKFPVTERVSREVISIEIDECFSEKKVDGIIKILNERF
jgi:UDP-2-acetamido-2-deoxy-ribo-hexuluronate aminotransferase